MRYSWLSLFVAAFTLVMSFLSRQQWYKGSYRAELVLFIGLVMLLLYLYPSYDYSDK